MSTLVQSETPIQKDFLPLNGTDHVEFWVGNARQSAYFYRLAFGLKLVAYAGPETGVRDRASYVLQQGKVRFVLTTPLRPDGDIAEHVRVHGDGVLWSSQYETGRAAASAAATCMSVIPAPLQSPAAAIPGGGLPPSASAPRVCQLAAMGSNSAFQAASSAAPWNW